MWWRFVRLEQQNEGAQAHPQIVPRVSTSVYARSHEEFIVCFWRNQLYLERCSGIIKHFKGCYRNAATKPARQ